MWENNFSGYVKINATAQALNLGTQFNPTSFNATMTEHKNLEDKTQLQTFLNANKSIVDPKKIYGNL